MANVYFAVPILGMIWPEARSSISTVVKRAMDKGHTVDYREARGDSLISRARQNMLNEFLTTDNEYIMWWDSDIKWHPKDKNDSVIDTLMGHGVPIIGGVYVIRGWPYHPSFRFLDNPVNPDLRGVSDLIEAGYVSNGCMLVKREVVESMMEEYEYPYQPYVYRGEYLSEDWAFCQRAKDLGYKCYIDTTIKLGHIGTYEYTLNDYYNVIDNYGVKVQGFIQKDE